jgi:hypothetical protein
MKKVLIVAACILGTPAFAAEGPKWATSPKVSKDGATVRIEFAANAETDCAVSILDAKGKVVRHLAAGVLGKNAPPPLQKNSLQQAVVWDGKDDLGKPAVGGPFQVRVGLGLKPQFDHVIGSNPAALGMVRALAVVPQGELYVFHVFGALHPNDGTSICSVFARDGKYLRTIMPYPANLPAEKTKGLKHVELDSGLRVPFIYQAETRSLVPGAGDLPPHRAVATRDGRVVFVGVQEGPHRYAQSGIAQVVTLHADGSVPDEGVLGTIFTRNSGDAAASLALAPDEKTVYAADVKQGKPQVPAHVVYRFGWSDKEATAFLGTLGKSGNDEKHLNDPKSVAVDKDGNIYVADKGNNRIAVFKADGSFLGALTVDRPERVEVHPKSGAIYVVGGPLVNELQKFASWKQAQPVAKLTLPFFKHPRYTVVTALDSSADVPLLWVGQPMAANYAGFTLLRIEDKGDSFGKPVDIAKLPANDAPSVGPVMDVNLDRERNLLYVDSWRYEVETKKLAKVDLKTGASIRAAGSMGLEGNLYALVYPNFARRYGPDLKSIPFAGSTDKQGGLVNPLQGTSRLRGRGVAADGQGNIYVLWQKGQEEAAPGPNYALDANFLYVYGPDGKLKKEKLIDAEIRSLNSVRVDYAGNIYLAVGLRPGKELLPSGFKDKSLAQSKDPDAVGGVNCYPLLYGSIVKFGPEGGTIKTGASGLACNYAFGTPIDVKGAQWIFSGASPVPSWRTKGTPDICLCESPRFDVDGFGRSFFPDAGRFRVGVIDTAGNEVAWLGAYGNQDSAGAGSSLSTPAIPLLWPYAVAVGDDAIYVGDRLNRRVLRVNLKYAAEVLLTIR